MPTRTCKILGVLALSAATAGAAHAEGLYFGAALGAPNYSSTINGSGGGGGGSGPGFGLYGGLTLAPYFAIEAGYADLARSRDVGGVAKTQSIYLDGVGSVKLAPKWALQGRLGIAEGWLETPGGDDHSPGLKIGAGLQYDLTPTYALRLGYDYYRFTSAFHDKANVGQTTLGLKVNF